MFSNGLTDQGDPREAWLDNNHYTCTKLFLQKKKDSLIFILYTWVFCLHVGLYSMCMWCLKGTVPLKPLFPWHCFFSGIGHSNLKSSQYRNCGYFSDDCTLFLFNSISKDLSLDQKRFLWPHYFSYEIFVKKSPFNTTVVHCKICSTYKEMKSNKHDHIGYLKINISSKAARDTWASNF